MTGLSMRRRSRTAPNGEVLLGVGNTIAVHTGGYRRGGLRVEWNRLSEEEQARVVELVREAGEGGSFAFTKLDDRSRRELERLIERAAEAPGVFENTRRAEEIRALATEAQREKVRRRPRQGEEIGLLAEMTKCFRNGWLDAPQIGVLTTILVALTAGETLGPRQRVEEGDAGPVLVVDASFGLLGENRDPDGGLGPRWKDSVEALEANEWLAIVRRGSEWTLGPGKRLRLALAGQPVIDRVVER